MAEALQLKDSEKPVMEQRRQSIIAECLRQEESCLYTSTTLYIWLRRVRLHKQVFVAAPIIFGGTAGLAVMEDAMPAWAIAVLALLASLFPALADALKIETNVSEISRTAADYKALQDRFRRVARITAQSDVDAAEAALSELMDRLDTVRSGSMTPPEWAFKKAQKKINAGDYSFAIDSPPPPGGAVS